MTGRRGGCAAVVALLWLCVPSPASATTQLGSTFPPADNCTPGVTYLQTGSPDGAYTVPFAGVITSWSFQTGPNPPRIKFKVGRATGEISGGNPVYMIVASSAQQGPPANTLASFPSRFPVEQGDVIGLVSPFDTLPCLTSAASGYSYHASASDLQAGSTAAFVGPTGGILDVSAVLESDCDGDGFGDETQDSDISSCAPGDLAAPNATISKGPKKKTRKKTATFRFSGTDARVLAGFQCSLDGAPFTSCSSPHKVKVKKGKHSFSVRAIDQAGNVDGTPAMYGWKVKKKKKK